MQYNYGNKGFLDNLLVKFRQGDILTRLLFINVAVFLFVSVVALFDMFFQEPILKEFVIANLALPADLFQLMFKPWTIITYMFLHESFWHILMNMLWLYWFGQLFVMFLSTRRLLQTYIWGGIAGAVFYLLAFNLIPYFNAFAPVAIVMGASAGIMAIVFAVATYQPNFQMQLMFIGNVPLKYLALIFAGIDILGIPNGNAGGHIAHLGGAVYGFLYASQLKKGNDWSKFYTLIADTFMSMLKKKHKPRMKVHRNPDVKVMSDEDYNKQKAERQKKIDQILEKIADKGYSSLTKEEKELLFKASKD